MSSRSDLKGAFSQPLRPSRGIHNAPQASILLPAGSTLESREISEPSFDEREIGAGGLFLLVLVLPWLFVLALALGYAKFIA